MQIISWPSPISQLTRLDFLWFLREQYIYRSSHQSETRLKPINQRLRFFFLFSQLIFCSAQFLYQRFWQWGVFSNEEGSDNKLDGEVEVGGGYPTVWSFQTMADPTRPWWPPAMKIITVCRRRSWAGGGSSMEGGEDSSKLFKWRVQMLECFYGDHPVSSLIRSLGRCSACTCIHHNKWL